MGAIGLWSLLALLTAASGMVPPFQLTALCFAMATFIGAIYLLLKPVTDGEGLADRFTVLKQPAKVWLLGVGGLFGYHFFYFTALRNAPPVEAGLIAYLWPLLIILFSALLPGERLRSHHIIGGLLGLFGAIVIISGGSDLSFSASNLPGYGAAVLCALIWSGYSVLSRRFAAVPSAAVTGFCAVSACLAALAHLVLEQTIWPQTSGEWLVVLGLGLGPVGLAFYIWDYGVKHGHIQVLGAASYLAPVLSTLALIAAGFAEPGWRIALATLLVTLGAVVAARDLLFGKN